MKTFRAYFLGAAAAVLASLVPAHSALDVMENGGAGDGLGDVWQLKFGTGTAAGALDSDGDGASNATEAGAGTNPNAPGDLVKVKSITINGGNVELKWPSVLGKRYRIQKSTDISNPNAWSDVTAYLNGTDAELTDSTPATPGTVYRVAVYDMDTDGDGVNDWEERQLGLDPENSHSHGTGAPNDLAWLTTAVSTTPAQQVVTITGPSTAVAEISYPGVLTVTRTAGLAPLTVTYTVSGSATAGSDYVALSGTAIIPFGATSTTIQVEPIADALVESTEAVIVSINPLPAYTVGQPATAGMLISDISTANGTGLTAQFWNEVSSGVNVISDTNPAKFAGAPAVTRVDPVINYTWADSTTQGVGSPAVGVNTNYFSSRWTGEVLAQYSQIYTFEFQVNRAGRLTVNGQTLVNNWPPAVVGSGTYSGIIELEAGKRYPIVVEQYETTGSAEAMLRWSGANLPEETIPAIRMFPTVAPQILSPLELMAFVGQPNFSYQTTASGSPTAYSAANLPPGLSINPTTGLISGIPTAGGTWQVVLTATNGTGSGSAILNLNIVQTGGGVTREVWTSLPGTSVASIPLGTAPVNPVGNPSVEPSLLSSLQVASTSIDDFGARIRGYISAPVTGVYQFFLSANDAAELYISDDAEPANSWLRASLTAASAAPPDWSTAAKAPLLYLKAGNRYFFEVRHKDGAGADHLAVGWSKPGEPTTAPSEVIPGYLLTQYTPPAAVPGTSTLYVTSMTAQAGALTNGYGNSSLQMNADKTQATVRFTYSNLTGPVTQKHVHSGADGGLILFDMDVTPQNPDGSYTWNIAAVNGVSDKDGDSDSDAADVVKLIEDGSAYINLHTAAYAPGEIKGFYRFAAGSQTFVPPPAVPNWATDPANAATVETNAVRFLQQSTFGATPAEIASVQSLGFEGWIDDQFTKPASLHYPSVFAKRNVTSPNNSTYPGDLTFNSWWERSVTGQDQLRQRIAFALSEILVVSEAGPLDDRADALSDYYDMLLTGHLDGAGAPLVIPGITGYDGGPALQAGVFGNFRDILIATTLHPAMGRYLDMVQNDKPDINTGRIPNENYAREILQLFSLGLNRLHPDGSLMLDSSGLPIATYDQDAVIGFSHAFTGWTYNYVGAYRTSFNGTANWIEPLREVPLRHYTGQKRLLNNVVTPGLPTVGGLPLNPNASHTAAQYNDPAYQALAAQELLITHNQIFNHPNIGPFICRQLIQRLVTSTPSRGYIHRVVQKFNDNGEGVRGDMKAVVKAILLDYEARSRTAAATVGFGKQREPLLRVTTMARAFPAPTGFTGTWQQDGGAIIIETTGNNRVSSGQAMTLNFGDTTVPSLQPLATSGTYTQSTVGGSVPLTTTRFAVRTRDVVRGAYTRSGTTATITTQANHGLATGQQAYVRFRDSLIPNGLYVVTVSSNTVFTVTTAASGSITGTHLCDVAFVRGSYRMAQPTAPATDGPITFNTTTIHGMPVGSNVWLDFEVSGTVSPADGMYTITEAGPTTFTVNGTYPTGITGTINEDFDGAPALPTLDRGGHVQGFPVNSGYSDYTMGNTDGALGQTPLGSPTVFNFFLPDYQYPGELAQAGLITPEFELTSDTTVIRQANFLYVGLFFPDNTTGLSSFRNNNADIGMDISPWMDIRPDTGRPWTDHDPANPSNDNLRNLIRRLGTLLMAGQMSQAMEDSIYNWVSNNNTTVPADGNIAYTNNNTDPYATASTARLTERRNRVRAVIHLIVTSPEFTIQK